MDCTFKIKEFAKGCSREVSNRQNAPELSRLRKLVKQPGRDDRLAGACCQRQEDLLLSCGNTFQYSADGRILEAPPGRLSAPVRHKKGQVIRACKINALHHLESRKNNLFIADWSR